MSTNAPPHGLIQEYLDALPLQMPLKHPDNREIMTLESLQIKCKKCGRETQDLRGSVVHHSTCMEIKAAGLCHPCQTITWTKTRVYPDHILAWQDSGLKSYSLKKPFWKKVLSTIWKKS